MGSKKKPEKTLRCCVSPLPSAERWFYFCVTVATIAYLCYCVYRDSIKYDGILNLYDFQPGWNIIGREQDISNFEWHFWSRVFWLIWPWYLGHVALGKVMEWNLIQYRKYAFLVFALFSLSAVMGWRPVCLIACHALLLYMASLTGHQLVVWISSVASLSTLNFDPFTSFMKGIVEQHDDDIWYYLLVFTLALSNIRCTSFCLENCWHHRGETVQHKEKPDLSQEPDIGLLDSHKSPGDFDNSFLDMLAYIFYLPLFFTGPILTYDLFKSQINAPSPAMTMYRVMSLGLNFLRVFFWAFFIELILHFMYFNSLQQSYAALKAVSLFTLAGIGYCQGQFFMVKYLVMFGLPAGVARVDNLDPPQEPKCIAYIHLYSDMWKYFDRGLYNYLKRYIYIPCGGGQHGYARQLLGSGLCFLYVYYWHGAEYYIAVWILLNCIGISLEGVGSVISKIPVVKKLEVEVLSAAMTQRIHAVLSIPVFLISCFSIFCFFGGQVVGYIFFERLIIEGLQIRVRIGNLFSLFPIQNICCRYTKEPSQWDGSFEHPKHMFKMMGWLTSYLTLMVLIYCAIQNCIEINRWQTRRERQKQHQS